MRADEWLTWLTSRHAASGREPELLLAIAERASDLADEATFDDAGSLTLRRRGQGGPTLLVAAHVDQVALWIKEILPGGFLRVGAPGQDVRMLPGQRVRAGRLAGVVGMKPPHLQKPGEQKEVVPLDSLAVDLGADEKTVRRAVSVGDPVYYDVPGRRIGAQDFTSPGLDNRASVAACLVALEELAGKTPSADIRFALTISEEVGLWGGRAAAEAQEPDAAIAVDVTFGSRGKPAGSGGTVPMGKGPAIGKGPNCHPGLVQFLERTARHAALPYQLEVMPGSSGTDAWAMQTAATGTRTGTVSTPLLHMHSPVEVVNVNDVALTGKLLAAVSMALDGSAWEEVAAWA